MTFDLDLVTLSLSELVWLFFLPSHKVMLRSINYQRNYRHLKFFPLPPLSLPPPLIHIALLSHLVSVYIGYTIKYILKGSYKERKNAYKRPIQKPTSSSHIPLFPLSPSLPSPLVYTRNLYKRGERGK